jgi:hypothetical protein
MALKRLKSRRRNHLPNHEDRVPAETQTSRAETQASHADLQALSQKVHPEPEAMLD